MTHGSSVEKGVLAETSWDSLWSEALDIEAQGVGFIGTKD